MSENKEKYIGQAKLSEEPKKPFNFRLGDKVVKNKHIDDQAVDARILKDGAIIPEKLNESVLGYLVLPITDQLDKKYTDITEELYSMISSLQVGGIALSQQFGNRTDIGISQKTLTKALGKFWDEMGTITGKDYMDFKLTVVPATTFSESSETITIKADCSDAISDFDNIRIYVDNVLVAESSDVEVFTTSCVISKTSEVKAVGTVLGKTKTKTMTAIKEIPFFMGSGQSYQDVMNMECHKTFVGTLEGDYDAVVKNNGEYLFVIIPASRIEEFRRCKMDMNGIEIPFTETQMTDILVCKSKSTYQAGTYNIDIDINS